MSWSGVIYHDKVPAEGWPFPTCIGLGRGGEPGECVGESVLAAGQSWRVGGIDSRAPNQRYIPFSVLQSVGKQTGKNG